jgi:hypothetical protein
MENLKFYTAIISLGIMTDTVISVRYEPQILHCNYNP